MTSTADVWKADSTILTYGGGSRSRRNGIFAGVTDIQGMDMYVNAMISCPIKLDAYSRVSFGEGCWWVKGGICFIAVMPHQEISK